MENKTEAQRKSYIAIDLKSFYASVECAERGLDPMDTNLVVADASRTEKTICLAVSPALKAYGIPGRARLFEVVQRVKEINMARLQTIRRSNGGTAGKIQERFASGCGTGEKMREPSGSGRGMKEFTGKSYLASELIRDPYLEFEYIAATPRMALYMEYSTRIYGIYLKYIAPEDIHVYSVDEVFIDATSYLETYRITAHELARRMIRDVFCETGITATAGIGTNLYLCKVAMDILAKHVSPDEDGVRIAQIDEMEYRRLLWDHQPLTDFWRVGSGYMKKLHQNGLYTMGDIARCSVGGDGEYHNEELLYRLFGINAELLIDHAWGWEPCTIAEIKAYRPENNSISTGQVLQCPYDWEKGRLIVREMTDLLVLDLVEKRLVTDQMVLTVGYDVENLTDADRRLKYKGEVKIDHYGREIPKHAHGSINLCRKTSSTKIIMEAVCELYDRIVNPNLLIRRINLAANNVVSENEAEKENHNGYEQLDLFTDYDALESERKEKEEERAKEKKMQEAMLALKRKFGKNAVLKGMNLEEGATAISRNGQIGGHKA